jgi:hypothetical protein
MRQTMFAFFHQVFCVPDPVAGLAGAGSFIVSQVLVQRFDKPDSFSQRNTECFVSFQTQLLKIFNALIPAAIARPVAMIATFAGCFEHVFMSVITVLNKPFNQFAGIQKGFDKLLLHWRSPLDCISILGLSANDLNRRECARRR